MSGVSVSGATADYPRVKPGSDGRRGSDLAGSSATVWWLEPERGHLLLPGQEVGSVHRDLVGAVVTEDTATDHRPEWLRFQRVRAELGELGEREQVVVGQPTPGPGRP